MKGLPDKITVFHWNSKTFDLLAGAVQLFESGSCRNQRFIYMGRVIALQFHPEVNEDRIQTLIKRFGDEMINGLFVQKKEENARTARTSGQHKGIYVFSAR